MINSLVADLIDFFRKNIKEEEPAQKGRWNLSLEQQATFLIANFKAIAEKLSEKNYKHYFDKIDEYYR